jgi:hypothetical protein
MKLRLFPLCTDVDGHFLRLSQIQVFFLLLCFEPVKSISFPQCNRSLRLQWSILIQIRTVRIVGWKTLWWAGHRARIYKYKYTDLHEILWGRDICQMVIRRPPTTAARVRSKAMSYVTPGGQSGTWTFSLDALPFPRSISCSTYIRYPLIHAA